MLKAILAYRFFILSSIRNDLTSRFARSTLGGLWAILHPLAQVAIFALVLSNVLKARLPGAVESSYGYALFLMAGTLAWNLFSDILSRSVSLFIEKGNLIKKMQFPRITLPVILLGSAWASNLILFTCILLTYWLLGHPPALQTLWIFPMMVLLGLLASGMGLILSTLNVFIRDLSQIVPIVLQLLFWMTPIVYPINIVPEQFKAILQLNPMTEIVTAYQSALLFNQSPDLAALGLLFGLALALMAAGLWLFRKVSPELVDLL